MELTYLVFSRTAGGVTVGDSRLCCCVSCRALSIRLLILLEGWKERFWQLWILSTRGLVFCVRRTPPLRVIKGTEYCCWAWEKDKSKHLRAPVRWSRRVLIVTQRSRVARWDSRFSGISQFSPWRKNSLARSLMTKVYEAVNQSCLGSGSFRYWLQASSRIKTTFGGIAAA